MPPAATPTPSDTGVIAKLGKTGIVIIGLVMAAMALWSSAVKSDGNQGAPAGPVQNRPNFGANMNPNCVATTAPALLQSVASQGEPAEVKVDKGKKSNPEGLVGQTVHIKPRSATIWFEVHASDGDVRTYKHEAGVWFEIDASGHAVQSRDQSDPFGELASWERFWSDERDIYYTVTKN